MNKGFSCSNCKSCSQWSTGIVPLALPPSIQKCNQLPLSHSSVSEAAAQLAKLPNYTRHENRNRKSRVKEKTDPHWIPIRFTKLMCALLCEALLVCVCLHARVRISCLVLCVSVKLLWDTESSQVLQCKKRAIVLQGGPKGTNPTPLHTHTHIQKCTSIYRTLTHSNTHKVYRPLDRQT